MMGIFGMLLSKRTLLLFSAQVSKQCVAMGVDLLVCVGCGGKKKKNKPKSDVTWHCIRLLSQPVPVGLRHRERLSVCACFHRRKVEIMHTHSLFTLLGERLMLHTSTVSVTTYNTLYEVMRPGVFFTVIHKHTFPDRLNIICHFLFRLFFFFFFFFQILTEQVCTQVVHKPHPEPDSSVKIQNPSKCSSNLNDFLSLQIKVSL